MTAELDALFGALWADYVALTPQAERVHRLLAARGEQVRNDHVALRTFGIEVESGGLAPTLGIGMAALARPFERLGYVPRERYRFDDKKLIARYWQHPDPMRPKIFISELCVDELSPDARAIVASLLAQLPAGFADRADLPYAGRPWRVTRAEYDRLLAESEYAAWVAAFGFRVNHFTVDVNALASFADLAAVNAFLVASGFSLNLAGGAIKGTPEDHLEQSSTRADTIATDLGDLPSCYYEFAKRYRLPSGELFHGFVPSSADRIFESTDSRG